MSDERPWLDEGTKWTLDPEHRDHPGMRFFQERYYEAMERLHGQAYDPTYTYRELTIDKATEIACKEPTLVDALSWIAVWESERVVRQAHRHFVTGKRTPDGAGWDTCFKRCFECVIKMWELGQ